MALLKQLRFALLLAAATLSVTTAQSNYDKQGNSIEYDPNSGLPEQATLDGKVTKLDDLSPVIFLNRTKAVLNCAAGSMQADLQFEKPFFGIVYADFDRNSACQLVGKGAYSYKLELPLKGCGTRQDPQRVFTNNIVVRFHPGLEMDGDEVITIVCRYPPPIAPPPAALPAPFLEPAITPLEPPLQGFQILLIICAILFLSLLLLGLGCSYYCLRNRNVRVIRRLPLISESGSVITKLSGSSLGHVSLLEGLKIPRAHAALVAASDHSDTLPSDYPSESPSSAHSEVEEVDTRSLRRPSTVSSGSYENRAFIPPPTKFDVQMRVKKSPAPPTPPASDTESQLTIQEQKLRTILEREETTQGLAVESEAPQTTFTYVPELHTQPVYSRVVRKPPTLSTLSTEMMDTRSVTEMVDTTHTRRYTAPPPIPEEEVRVVEPPVVPARRPEVTSHVVDDVFLRTITEKKTIEDIERHRRQITEYHAKPPPPRTKWDVVIRNYPQPGETEEPVTDWESYSDTSSASGFPTTPIMAQRTDHHSSVNVERTYRSSMSMPPPPVPEPAPPNWDVLIRVLDQPEIPEPRDDLSDASYTTNGTEEAPGPSITTTTQLTAQDKEKWRQILTTESTLRTMLTEATVREDYERIRKDQRYEKLFEPHKWDVIIRVLAPPERLYDPKGGPQSSRYRKKQDWDTRSRRSSLPTLYEYDSDGSSIRTMTDVVPLGPHDFGPRSRRTSRSSLRSDMDVRSMTEVLVDYSRPDRADTISDVSGPSGLRRYYDDDDLVHMQSDDDYGGLSRSLSQPSLARSASEMTEHWAVTRASQSPSPRSSARSTRSSRGPAPLRPALRAQGAFVTESTSVTQREGGAEMRYSATQQSQVYHQQQRGGWFDADNNSEDSYK